MKKRETIEAHTPTPEKQPVRVDREKYELIRDAIVAVLRKEKEIAFKDLPKAVGARLKKSFEGSIGWYTTTVKLDMEVRGIIERVPGRTPQRLRLKKG